MFIRASGPKLVWPLRLAYAVSCNENPVLPRNRRRESEKKNAERVNQYVRTIQEQTF